jgi:hypothetical protein
MALMKMGRKGDPPIKKKKATDTKEVTVSADKPVAKSTWEDVDYNEAAKKTNANSLSTYDKQSKFYNESQKSGSKDLKTMFSGGGRYLNADELKRWNSENSNNSEDRAGLEAEKIYVPKDFKYDSPSKGKSSTAAEGYKSNGPVYHEILKKPSKPNPLPIRKINNNDLDLGKLSLLKPNSLPTRSGRLKESPEKDKPEDWSIRKPSRFSGSSITDSAPSLNRRKAVKGEGSVKFGQGIQNSRSEKAGVKKLAYAAVANPLQRVRFNKEVRQGKAYFGSNEGSTSGNLATKRSDLKSDKAKLKTAIKDVKRGSGKTFVPTEALTKSERIKGYRAEIGNVNKDLRTTKKASRYLSNLGQPSANTKITEYKTSAGDVKTINTGKIQYATPGRFEGYSDSPQNKRVDKLADLKLKPSTIKAQPKIGRKSNNKLKN